MTPMIKPLTIKCYPNINRLAFMRGNNYIGRVVLAKDSQLPELILEPENRDDKNEPVEKLYLMEVQDIFNAWINIYEASYVVEGKSYKEYEP